MNSALRNSLLKASLYTLLFGSWFLVLPLVHNHAQKRMDADYYDAIVQHLSKPGEFSEAERQQRLSYINTHPVSGNCASNDEENRAARESLWEPIPSPNNFTGLNKSPYCLILGQYARFALAGLGLLAFINEKCNT